MSKSLYDFSLMELKNIQVIDLLQVNDTCAGL